MLRARRVFFFKGDAKAKKSNEFAAGNGKGQKTERWANEQQWKQVNHENQHFSSLDHETFSLSLSGDAAISSKLGFIKLSTRAQRQRQHSGDGSFIKAPPRFVKRKRQKQAFLHSSRQEFSEDCAKRRLWDHLDGFGWCRLIVHPITFHFWRSRPVPARSLYSVCQTRRRKKKNISRAWMTLPSGVRGWELWSNIFIILWAKKIEHDALCALNSSTTFSSFSFYVRL